MPFPNFHSGRIRDPDSFSRIVQIDEAEDGAIRFIGGPLKSDPGGGAVVQAVRFHEDKFTPEQARKYEEIIQRRRSRGPGPGGPRGRRPHWPRRGRPRQDAAETFPSSGPTHPNEN